MNRLNSLYTEYNNLEVGGSIYADNLKTPTVTGDEILICDHQTGKIENSGLTVSDISGLQNGNFNDIGIDAASLTLSGNGVGVNQNTLNVNGDVDLTGDVDIGGNLDIGKNITCTDAGFGIITANKFVGDGTELTLNPNVNRWDLETNGTDIYYELGSVRIGSGSLDSELIFQGSNGSGKWQITGNFLELVSGNRTFMRNSLTDGDVYIGNSSIIVDISGQKVAIGTGSLPTETLEVGGDSLFSGDITVTGDVVSTSDISLKENIEVIPNPIEKVKELSGYTFNRIGQDKRTIGLMAQDVEKVLPEAVSSNNGIKSLAYGNLVALLVETVKEQQKQIDELREKIDK
jgi:predicted acyltransferase (DUF342 family)